MKLGRPTRVLLLSSGERTALEAWSRQPKCPQALAQRARVILLCANGRSNTETAAELRLTIQTVGKWRQRFLEKRLLGLLDAPRPGTPRKSGQTDAERVLGLTLKSPPGNAAQWSTRLLGEVAGLSRASVHRLWRAYALQPQREETFKLLRESILTARRT